MLFSIPLYREYSRLPSGLEEHDALEKSSSNPRRSWSRWLLALSTFALVGASSFFLGRCTAASRVALPEWADSMPRAPVGFIRQTWRYDPKFGHAPLSNNVTESDWDALVPKGQGFVIDPPDARHPSAISAVHQLHCLYSIRRAVFRDPDGGPVAGLSAHHLLPPHLRHCFDYLRQALLCAADATLEPWNTELVGVTGWGVPRVCRDYAGLKAWAEERRANDREGFTEVVVPSKEKDAKNVEQ